MPTTKKELEQEFGITRNTVMDTLKSCLLDTAKREYSDEEKARFAEARKLLSNKKSYEEVRAYFEAKTGKQKIDNSNPLYKAIKSEVEASTKELVRQAVAAVMQQLPEMTAEAYLEHMKTGQISETYRLHRQEYFNNLPTQENPLLEAPLEDEQEGKNRSHQLDR